MPGRDMGWRAPFAGAAAVLLLAVPDGPAARAVEPILDWVQFGDEASEQAHALTQSHSVVEGGGLGEKCRRIGPNGHLTWNAKCSPQEQNYLTVKLWGSDTGRGQLYLYDGERRIGGYQDSWPELDRLGGRRGADPVLPGRFCYSTYMIPPEMTRGKAEVTLRIGSTGEPTPYSRDRREADQKELSRGIYRAYVGTDPYFMPLPDETQGTAPESAEPLEHPEGLSPVECLHRQIDLAVDRFLTWQYYGSEWDQWVEEEKGPAILTGAFNVHGAKDAGWTKQQYKDTLAARMGGNRVALLVPEIYARAYHAVWSKHYHREELVDRVVKALDYARLAQGNNGGFDDIWTHRWVGGPDRRKTGNCLEGFGHMGLPAAFLLLHTEIEAKGYLDERVDEDDDPGTAEVTRREAWTRLFLEGRNYLVSDYGRGHAPNQDMADIVAAYLDDQCLHSLAPEQAWPAETRRKYVYTACGLEKDVYGGYWISSKGLSCEPHGTSNGGYCGCYGDLSDPLFRLAGLTGDRQVEQRALQCAHALAKFRYPSLDAESRPVIRSEGVITWRNNWTPGVIAYGGNPYAAVALNDPLSLREIQLAAHQGGYYRVEPFQPGPYSVHLPAVTAGLMRQVDLLEKALSLPPTEARLPSEAGQPDFAWADEQAAAVVVKQGENRLLMSLNWRHGFDGGPNFGRRAPEHAAVSNIARVHYTTPTMERIANVRMESPQGFGGLYVCRYGPYLVAMNANWSTLPGDAGGPVAFAVPESVPEAAVNLIDSRLVDLRTGVVLPEETTLVLDLRRPDPQ